MGVNGLWSVVSPTARPTKLETLNRKRLAVDASIWIYQFLKAVRDKEGNALRNSHVVGFFRRICKLLYFGILPVFVFDGGAPGLKRETIQKRRRRREGRREDATRTAGKLLAVQVARAAEEEDKRQRETRNRPDEETVSDGEELVYVDELGMSRQEREKERGTKFKRKDQYHLPDLDVSIESMGAPNDPRIMSQAELEEYARQFHSGEDINFYDFSKIDFESPFFLSLPASDRYNILNAARLRSRLRMGYSKEQLDGMFPDRMAFSKFQIDRVKERNELTQRLMHINGMNEDWDQGGRIAGEKGKEYVLVKNDGVEGGWALGVVSNKQGTKINNAIDLEAEEQSDSEMKDDADEDEFEDVAIEGLNRLPKSMKSRKNVHEVDYDISYEEAVEAIARKRNAVYEGRKKAAQSTSIDLRPAVSKASLQSRPEGSEEENDLFVAQDHENGDENEDDDLFEDVPMAQPEEDEELQRAIAMSLDTYEQPAGGFVVKDQETNNASSQDSDDDMDLAAALAESRRSKYKSKANPSDASPLPPPRPMPEHDFSGPLPFESLNLGQSLLGKKKAHKIEEGMSGGFDRDAGEDTFKKPKKLQPVPSWFQASSGADFKPKADEPGLDDQLTYDREGSSHRETLTRQRTQEVIDLESEGSENGTLAEKAIDGMYYGEDHADATLHSSEDQSGIAQPLAEPQTLDDLSLEEQAEKEKAAEEREQRYQMAREIAAEGEEEQQPGLHSPVRMGDVAEHVRADPPAVEEIPNSVPNYQPTMPKTASGESDEDDIEWSESDDGRPENTGHKSRFEENATTSEAEIAKEVSEDEDENEAFEDVDMEPDVRPPNTPPLASPEEQSAQLSAQDELQQPNEMLNGNRQTEDNEVDDYLSESDEELMRQLALEAEGHAEFASSLNQIKTPAQAARDYENELKQLRNQQKKDRRDADEVTQVMVQECQALLRLFGLPYITAPMEAEAQCAELVHLGLVDGIVTDDSDIFLFGGTRIYKNMFNAAKFVECYLAQDLVKEYDLDRRKLIRFAHLLGSDYTEGIPGIGPVTALEIISDFGTLEDFRDWCGNVQLGRPQDLENQLTTAFRRKFKKTVQKKLFLPPVFPDVRVDSAYLNPEVDSNPEDFQWGIPDLDKLRSFLMATIGWTQDRTDEILVPVIRDMNQRVQDGTQANITRFFAGGVGVGAVEGAAPRNRTGKESGRMKNAYSRLRGEAKKKRQMGDDAELADDENVEVDDVEADTNVVKRKSDRTTQSTVEGDEDLRSGSTRSKGKKRKTKS